jgi:hypothetical protein
MGSVAVAKNGAKAAIHLAAEIEGFVRDTEQPSLGMIPIRIGSDDAE